MADKASPRGIFGLNKETVTSLSVCLFYGFASLALAGHAAVPTGRERATALESALAFAVRGLCATDDALDSP
jgi:putative copper export protein